MQNEPGQDKLVFINYVIDWILSHTTTPDHTTQSQIQPSPIDTTTNTPAIQVSPASPIVEDPTVAAVEGRDSKL